MSAKTIINEVRSILPGVLGFKCEEEKHDTRMTGLAGLPVYLDLMHVMGLSDLIGHHLQVKQRGWTNAQISMDMERRRCN